MPVARYALQYAAQLAQLLGSGWSASGCDSSTFAVLDGPGIELGVSTTSPIRSRTKVRVQIRSRGDLVWRRRTDYDGQVSGTIGDPAEVADAIRTEILPAWEKLVTELEARTVRTRAVIREFAPLAAEAAGGGTSVTYGSRPGVADIRWDGGHATLWASDDGRISSPSIEITRARGAATVLALLRTAAGPVPDPKRFSVSDIGSAAARLLGADWSATSWQWHDGACIEHRDDPGGGYTLAAQDGHLYVSANLRDESRTFLTGVSTADSLETIGAAVAVIVRSIHDDG
ncbi:hypothetical protein ACF1A9_19905 [Streptomyces sp. NPDC014872]|uniref:hypothetical protein n=1 Tax=Streptomyces sp. NPDC014872 TaxID=3364926 RepID=UPI0036FD4839